MWCGCGERIRGQAEFHGPHQRFEEVGGQAGELVGVDLAQERHQLEVLRTQRRELEPQTT